MLGIRSRPFTGSIWATLSGSDWATLDTALRMQEAVTRYAEEARRAHSVNVQILIRGPLC